MSSPNTTRPLLADAAERAIGYLEGLPERPVVPTAEALERLAELGGPLPNAPTPPSDTLALLDRVGSPATVASAGPRYFGFVTGGSLPAPLAANWLAAAWDQNAGLRVMSPVAAALEDISIRWLVDLLGLPATSGAGFVTGATMANFAGLAAARHAVLKRAGWDVEDEGLFGAPPVTVLVGEEVHVSLLKALSLLGLGRSRVVRVAVDGQGRMRPDALPAVPGPAILCIQAGNVNTGAVDPAGALCEWARARGAWIHVDGAFGLWLAAAPARAHLAEGIASADSWATDAHKWLNVPYDSGIVFCREPDHLAAAMSTAAAAYLSPEAAREPDAFTPEMSRRARGVEVWAALRSLGRSGVAGMIERTCSHAAAFAEGLRDAGFDVLNDVVANQVLVSFGDADRTRRVIAAVQSGGKCWAGGTVWRGQAAMRISVSSWATGPEDVAASLDAIVRAAGAAR